MSRLHPIKIQKLFSDYKIQEEDLDKYNSIKLSNKDINIVTDLDFMSNTIYHSSNIEYEDELTVENTRLILKSIIKSGNKEFKNKNLRYDEILVENMFYAYEQLKDLLNNKLISCENIYDIHYSMMVNLKHVSTPGKPRKFEATISGREDVVQFTNPYSIEIELKALIADINRYIVELQYNMYKDNISKLDKILDFKRRFIAIHPFEDGNGRMSRLLFQFLLIKSNLPLCSFKGWKRKDYHNGMHIAYITKGNMQIIKSMYLTEVLEEKEGCI